jgi:hypothetical protein
MVAVRRSLEKACGTPHITRKNRFVHFYLPLIVHYERQVKMGEQTGSEKLVVLLREKLY